MSKRKSLHQRINWPDDVDLRDVAIMIASGPVLWRVDAAGLDAQTVIAYQKERFGRFTSFFANGNYKECEIAAMWYAVMRTAIETYGLKTPVSNGYGSVKHE